MTTAGKKIVHTEGESNTSDARARWLAGREHAATRQLLERDAEAFLHQSLSTPCLSTVARADGIWIEDTAGRRTMDFHGNSVHHIGYAHPKVVAAIKAQLDELTFAPRRYACEPAVELAETLGRLSPFDRAARYHPGRTPKFPLPAFTCAAAVHNRAASCRSRDQIG